MTVPTPRCPTPGSPATCPCSGPSRGWSTSAEHGGSPYLLGAVVPASGLPKAEVVAAARALVAAGYAEALTNHAGDIVRFTAISPEARRLAGLWPTPQGEWDRLLEQLAAAGGEGADRRRAAALAGVRRRGRRRSGSDDGALLMSALIGGYVPRAR